MHLLWQHLHVFLAILSTNHRAMVSASPYSHELNFFSAVEVVKGSELEVKHWNLEVKEFPPRFPRDCLCPALIAGLVQMTEHER